MSNPRLSVAELREKLGQVCTLDPLPGWRLPGHEFTIPRGALVEILGSGSREWLCALFRENANSRIAWIEPKLTLFPPALKQRGVDLSRLLFLETEKEWLWSLQQILRAKLFHFAVTPAGLLPERNTDVFLRKLQIQAERGGTTLFFLSETESPFFAITHRIRIEAGSERAEILKRKRG